MRKNMITKLRWFWAWQDEAEETWLGRMSQRGYHLFSVGLPGIYTFSAGEPRDYVYRLDYQTFRKKDRQEYLQLFRDSGWEHVGEMSAWQYFRKEAIPGETNEIFTDAESKIGMYRRVVAYLSFFFIIMFVIFGGRALSEDPYPWWGAIQLVLLLVLVLFGYSIIRLAIRIRQLNKRIRK